MGRRGIRAHPSYPRFTVGCAPLQVVASSQEPTLGALRKVVACLCGRPLTPNPSPSRELSVVHK